MTETITTTLTCGDCGVELVKKRGGKPKYCPPCAKVRTRTSAREAGRRRAAGVRFEIKPTTCVQCKVQFTHTRAGGQQPERCPTCAAQRFTEYQVRYREARGHFQVGSIATFICSCGTPFDWTVIVGRRPWKCRCCLDTAYMLKRQRDTVIARLKRPDPDLDRVCVDCGCDFQQRKVCGPIIVRCPDCTQVRADRFKREYSAALSSALIAARQVTFQIEGRWSCCAGCGDHLSNQRIGIFREWCGQCLPQHQRDLGKAWRLRNPDAARALSFRANKARRARLANVISEPYERQYIFDRDKWICQLCKKKILKKYTGHHPLAPSIDHQIPLELGGPDTPANVTAAHVGCNSAKRSRYMPKGEQLALVG